MENMNFERGKEVRNSLGIGLEKCIRDELEAMIEKHGFRVQKIDLRKIYEKKLSEKYGLHIGLQIEEFKAGDAYLVAVSFKGLKDSVRVLIGRSRGYTNDTGPR